MTPLPRRLRLAAALSAALIAIAAQAQPTVQSSPPAIPPAAEPTSPAPVVQPRPASRAARQAAVEAEAKASALSAELFYEVLVGEITARSGDPGAGYALVLDAAQRARDPELFQRAVEIALQSRSGEAALAAARAWKQSLPDSREARRFELQILIALNRIDQTAEPLRAEIAATPLPERPFLMTVIARTYGRAADKKQAASVVEQALVDDLKNPATAGFAWATVGRLRLGAGDPTGALEAAIQGQQADPSSEGPPLLALELMDPDRPLAEPLVKRYLATPQALPELRIGYARELMEARRYAEATAELSTLTRDKPELPGPWILLGSLQAQGRQDAQAEASIKRYLGLAEALPAGDEGRRGLTQAYLLLSQLAERRKDFAEAGRWLDRVDSTDEAQVAQMRRAGLLARQGKMQQARELIRALPERTPDDAKQKFQAEVQLLRDAKQYQVAYDLLAKASAADPDDADLIYDQAMMAEKINRLDEMERLLRRQIALKPDSQNAYNALGYSFADRKIRLEEARTLIRKAVDLAPQDPFIADSLGWVEFRLGNTAEAVKILEAAYQRRPDAEIGAHLGEVLWAAGDRDRAMAIWREASLVDAENETLQETLKRLRVKL
ncbi:tetratricopeptide repeat protein [Variovorax arabinosiphilus]|uniref:tetratricopeptide repeat protein n=1 Tax=Variovorax arabinosiphilus TaxID=3053498 RepID=UPI002576D84B|nr:MULTISPECIES: tetratricopeptide repeat protein [unclassified Variovorax]MDM0120667.1 tetratricopeptide repeat protein [Variovorax sp. J2L1-78]MDM0127421.1 tetratricopeptide repeat protein [Variovorax sp. J2L1-63]MDM0231120.1 tetratricopeptide repeat protein [Variovorax sp. J2R1-6]